MQTGENEQALRKILDMTRLISIIILVLHFYYYCYAAFEQWHLTLTLTDRLISNIRNTGLFQNFLTSKLFALGFLLISLIGARGRKDEKVWFKKAFACIITGLVLYFLSYLFLLSKLTLIATAIIYQYNSPWLYVGAFRRHFIVSCDPNKVEHQGYF